MIEGVPIRYEDRTDREKWAHPMVEWWTVEEVLPSLADTLGNVFISNEEKERLRKATEDMAVEMGRSVPVPEGAAEYGTNVDYTVEVPEEIEAGAAPIRVLVRTPNGPRPEAGFPVVFSIPGGGLQFCPPELFMIEIMTFCQALDAVVVCPQYRTLPWAVAPAPVNDLQAAYIWVVENAKSLGIDVNKIILQGGSSGGHLAAALTHRLKRCGYPKGIRPRAQVLEFPVLEDREFEGSKRILTRGNGWSVREEHSIWSAWLGEDFNKAGVPAEVVPGHAVGDDFKDLPPAFIHCAESDGDRDAAIRYAQGLLAAGVFCDFHVWAGMNHTTFFSGKGEPVVRFDNLLLRQMQDAIDFDLWRD